MSGQTAELQIPDKLVPVFEGEADVRGSYGGRGSAKTRTFAIMTAIRAYMWDQAGRTGIILCCRQFMNSLDDSSMEEIKEAIAETEWLASHFDIGEKYIRTKSGRVAYKFSGLDRNINSIKSKSRILLCWIDEAEPVTDEAYVKLIPTLREEDSELWVTWNPESKRSATHKRFRESTDPRYKVVQMNWRDNPWFPAKLARDMERDKLERPEQVDHIWEGGFKTVVEGAYFASHLIRAREEKRITRVPFDPMHTVKVFCDIGGTGAKADAFSMWPMQFIQKQILTRDYYEARGQDFATHVHWLRRKGYKPENTTIVLPHDGETNDRVIDISYESAFRKAGYDVEVIPNQGKGAAAGRIEAGRQNFNRVWFDEDTTEAGRDALAWYHEKRSEDERDFGMGPEHDWASHAADAFGLAMICYEEPVAMEDNIEYERGFVV